MKTIHELHAFIEAYASILGYSRDAEAVTRMLAMDYDETLIYDLVPEAQSVIDAYLLWGAARNYQEEGETK